ncbi:hypothetical protein SODALDRAFT_374262 [Sodiomyces alkalinus F11]|uniref:Pre-mRNA-splicing factor CWC26 n=1 Tax=Sodiomyces alkalinus (strain CBS 110278 / VKM F-3762 / F11) TaxID=1314773 RepID=A0A3N2Q503_SODAK|nr:hypothetical protein SODALDRAFT_374262 [Sodiomyces alkalinus F11]ROT41849.1 hypothetical protein SODALDRAFT_374262 [Sodiomyces alkalinus F11]
MFYRQETVVLLGASWSCRHFRTAERQLRRPTSFLSFLIDFFITPRHANTAYIAQATFAMPSDLSSFLATRYLVADPKPSKKRKRKQATDGLIIADDDDSWANPSSSRQDNDDSTLDGSVTVSGTSADFRRSKKSNWKSLNGQSTTTATTTTTTTRTPATDSDAAAANAILASAAAESSAAHDADDELPTIAHDGGGDPSVVKMSDGTHAGLQSAASVAAQLRKRREAEEAEFTALRKKKTSKKNEGKEEEEEEEETVYRDATGRRVDVAMKRAEARRMAAEQEERDRERQAKTTARGDVQAAEARARREALEEAKTMTFARTADDEEMNREMKDRQRWNDPMAQFMDTADSGGGAGDGGGKSKKGKGRRPVYTGAAPPNRYGIRPGYRWDGVDRSNGFEGERFKAINRRERNKGLDYAWQMDE